MDPANDILFRKLFVQSGPWPEPAPGDTRASDLARALADFGGLSGDPQADPQQTRFEAADEHVKLHQQNGDYMRWGKLGGARPRLPKAPPEVEGLGLLGLIPDVTGVLSGRIRTDTPWRFWADMSGYPAPDDVRRAREDMIKNGI